MGEDPRLTPSALKWRLCGRKEMKRLRRAIAEQRACLVPTWMAWIGREQEVETLRDV